MSEITYIGAHMRVWRAKGATKRCKTCVYKRNRDRRKKFGMTAEQKERKNQLQRERRAAAKEAA